jgi:sensor histidine kinase regulating citrate/malate metabolism
MKMASVGFSFSMTAFVVAIVIAVVVGVGFGMFANYKHRQPPSGLSERGSLLWRLAPIIGLGGGLISVGVLFSIWNEVEHPWHTYPWTNALVLFVGVGLSMGLRRLVEKRVR